jgi:hypothetical protein
MLSQQQKLQDYLPDCLQVANREFVLNVRLSDPFSLLSKVIYNVARTDFLLHFGRVLKYRSLQGKELTGLYFGYDQASQILQEYERIVRKGLMSPKEEDGKVRHFGELEGKPISKKKASQGLTKDHLSSPAQ